MDPDIMSVVQHLARYLCAYPDACDSAEGIARWWGGAAEQGAAVGVVEAALQWMSACGVVETWQAADGRVLYRGARGDAHLQARLQALAADPRALLPGGPAPRSLH
ncbi:hypothetical protein PEC18_32875 [Paucibacter sp. O1-1]|nr:hypothetical protein [Paucibacter sp. O1-1]MDA3830496.1 hypothetical protein [Paucibacter sp. O1-1]